MHEEHEDVRRICEMRKTLIHWTEAEMSKGMEAANCAELGAVVDMIKDLCEAENDCREAAYHKSVTDAMEDYQPSRMGYTPSADRMPRRMTDSGRNWAQARDVEMREPYRDDRTWERNSEPQRSRYGQPFDEYRKAKRHYTETHSESDKKAMEEYANEHFMDMLSTIREIWNGADVNLKQHMKTDMTKLVGEMTI